MNKNDLSQGPAPPGWSSQKEGNNAVVAKTRVSSGIDRPQQDPNPSSQPIHRASESPMSPCSGANLLKCHQDDLSSVLANLPQDPRNQGYGGKRVKQLAVPGYSKRVPQRSLQRILETAERRTVRILPSGE
ncbi:hypothetical protein NDU88_004988 [Pleurodeles waltl]|uniref:Uncharacterized protein n=1 Tax=Pleurodeles waltl TaxID=8319 RepID=A0AAV7W6L4_PLEWA|nr:hypothetical protein NDU88_004988 [Pleurodeles waltl]